MSIFITLAGIGFLGYLLLVLLIRYLWNGGFYRRYCNNKTKLHGKTVIITGGNGCIGKQTAIDLARRGARVIIGCRNPKQAEEAVKEIQRRSGNNNVMYHPLDLSDQESVREFANIILKEELTLDYLINNAGIEDAAKGHRTKEGYDMVFAVNHFGHFLLTNLLMDLLRGSAPSRIINVTSVNHLYVKRKHMDFTQEDDEGRTYPGLQGYPRSKLANVLFTKELARRLNGTNVTAYSLHPGICGDSILRKSYEATNSSSLLYWMTWLFLYFIKTTEEAIAQTTIHCTVEHITHLSGRYFDNCRVAKDSEAACDAGLAKKLWEVSCQATGL